MSTITMSYYKNDDDHDDDTIYVTYVIRYTFFYCTRYCTTTTHHNVKCKCIYVLYCNVKIMIMIEIGKHCNIVDRKMGYIYVCVFIVKK